MKHTKKPCLALLAVLLLPFAAQAGPIALDIEFDDPPLFDSRTFTFGWAFSVSEEITVDALGAWDQDADGLATAQTVTIWTAAGLFLAAVSVDNTATGVAPGFPTNDAGQWLRAEIANVVLGIGDYVIGTSRFGNGTDDGFLGGDTVIQTDARLTYTGGRFSAVNFFGFPQFDNPGTPGMANFFGPTFWIADTVVGVPEPGTLLLFGLGLIACGAARRGRKGLPARH